MADNALVTIILAFSLTLAVISGVLGLIYFFYKAQRKAFLGDQESLSMTVHGQPCHNKPLPPTPPTDLPVNDGKGLEDHSAPREPPRPSIIERRKYIPAKASRLPLRSLRLNTPQATPAETSHRTPTAPLAPIDRVEETVQLGLNPEPLQHAGVPLARPRRLSKRQVANMQDNLPRPSISEHPIWESDEDPENTATSGDNLNDNKF